MVTRGEQEIIKQEFATFSITQSVKNTVKNTVNKSLNRVVFCLIADVQINNVFKCRRMEPAIEARLQNATVELPIRLSPTLGESYAGETDSAYNNSGNR